MAVKKPGESKGAKKPVDALIATALAAAMDFLASPQVREKLVNAPKEVIGWARNRYDDRVKATPGVGRYSLKAHFGQQGLERRVEALATSVNLMFPHAEDLGRDVLMKAVAEMRRAVAVAGSLPLVKRKRAHFRIDNQLDRLEMALVDAVLPKA